MYEALQTWNADNEFIFSSDVISFSYNTWANDVMVLVSFLGLEFKAFFRCL